LFRLPFKTNLCAHNIPTHTQSAAVHRGVLQCVGCSNSCQDRRVYTHIQTCMQCAAGRRSVLQCVAECRSVLQGVEYADVFRATHCNMLHYPPRKEAMVVRSMACLSRTALQHAATRCNTLHYPPWKEALLVRNRACASRTTILHTATSSPPTMKGSSVGASRGVCFEHHTATDHKKKNANTLDCNIHHGRKLSRGIEGCVSRTTLQHTAKKKKKADTAVPTMEGSSMDASMVFTHHTATHRQKKTLPHRKTLHYPP